jgi:hypothetical protein
VLLQGFQGRTGGAAAASSWTATIRRSSSALASRMKSKSPEGFPGAAGDRFASREPAP